MRARTRFIYPALVAAAGLGLAACSQAPVLRIPPTAVADAYKEGAEWQAAQPADDLPRDAWWHLYGDEQLNALEQGLIDNSPDLAAALARYRQAKATDQEIAASRFPTLSTSVNAQRDRQSESKPLRVLGPLSPDEYSSATLGFDLGYEFDLWGRVSDSVASGRALEQAARADLASARLSLQAQLADNYLALRGLDRQVALLRDTEAAYTRELEMVQARHDGGIASGLDLARAQAQRETTSSQLKQTLAQRALVEHSIAALVGAPATNFSLEPSVADIRLPAVPPGLPSTLLQRRPDIAAAQRRVVSANASVGVAKAAYFPSLTLDAQYGYQSGTFHNLVTAPNVFWAVGPTLFLELIDGGLRQAQVAHARAVLDEAGANYRSVVVAAFQQVEDGLSLLANYRSAATSQAVAVAATQHSLDMAKTRYREGASSYLDVVVSETDALQARREAEDLNARQLRASVQLIRALGGGWTQAAP